MTLFGTLLRQHRMLAGLSQNECSRRSDIDQAYVHLMESGKRSAPGRDIVLRLAATLSLGAYQTDRLLIAAGHCPELIRRMHERQFEALYLLAQPLDVDAAPVRLRAVQ
jgi:transcriptional regulator with XRE-family HTH domain